MANIRDTHNYKDKEGEKHHLEFATFRVCCLRKVARKAHWQKNFLHKRLKINLVCAHNFTLRRAFLMKKLYNKSRIINILYRRQRHLRFTIFRFLFFSFLFFFSFKRIAFLDQRQPENLGHTTFFKYCTFHMKKKKTLKYQIIDLFFNPFFCIIQIITIHIKSRWTR